MIRRPPRSTRTDTLFPYTPLCRSPAMLVAEGGSVWQLAPWRADASAGGVAGDGAILSPMPGKVIAVDVAAGDKVTKGQKLLTLEAMKMEHSLTAPFDGIVAELNRSAERRVGEGCGSTCRSRWSPCR